MITETRGIMTEEGVNYLPFQLACPTSIVNRFNLVLLGGPTLQDQGFWQGANRFSICSITRPPCRFCGYGWEIFFG